MSQVPVDRIQIPDDNGELRKDTMMIEEMKAASQKTLDALFEAWRQLRNITSQHKPSLEKRWRKKTEVQRRAILNKVCPGIPAIHRPDLLALREEFRTKELPFSLDIALRFPYINLEDLSKPEAFLLFLESRSNNFPALFSNTDRSHIRVGIRAKMIVPDYVRGYTMYMNGEQTRETYGRIVSWKQDRQSLFKCHSGVAPDPGIGLVILRIQRDILQFLVRCSAAIMHDIPTADLINGSEQALPDPSTHQVICQPSIANIDSLSVHMLEAPYRLPDMFNFARLRSLIRARRCEVEDHFVSIREDPGCFAEVICAASVDVRQTRMDGRPQARAKTDSTWNTAVSLVLGTAYYDVFRWEAVSYLCNGLMIAYEEEKESIQPGKTLPNAFVRAFSPLDFPPENPTVVQFGYLPYYRLGAPSFKKHTDPTLSPSKTSQKGMHQEHAVSCISCESSCCRCLTVRALFSIAKFRSTFVDDYLFWLFKEMLKVQSDKQKAICGLHSLLQENEIFITRKLEEKARLTPGLTRMISELSGVAEMQRELSLSSCNEYSLTAMPKEDIIASVNPRMIPLGNIQKVVNENSFDLASTVKDLRLFDYPSDKTRTAATTAKMRSAEQALDHFWERVNQHFVSKTGKTLKELEEDKIVHRNIERNATVGRGQIPDQRDRAHQQRRKCFRRSARPCNT